MHFLETFSLRFALPLAEEVERLNLFLPAAGSCPQPAAGSSASALLAVYGQLLHPLILFLGVLGFGLSCVCLRSRSRTARITSSGGNGAVPEDAPQKRPSLRTRCKKRQRKGRDRSLATQPKRPCACCSWRATCGAHALPPNGCARSSISEFAFRCPPPNLGQRKANSAPRFVGNTFSEVFMK